MTAYAFFVQTCREEHKKKFPGEQIVFAEFSKKCAEKWKVAQLLGLSFPSETATKYGIFIFYNNVIFVVIDKLTDKP